MSREGGTSLFGDWWFRPKKIGDLDEKKVGHLVIPRRCGDGDLPKKIVVIWAIKSWWFGDLQVKIQLLAEVGPNFIKMKVNPSNLSEFTSKTIQKLVMVI